MRLALASNESYLLRTDDGRGGLPAEKWYEAPRSIEAAFPTLPSSKWFCPDFISPVTQ